MQGLLPDAAELVERAPRRFRIRLSALRTPVSGAGPITDLSTVCVARSRERGRQGSSELLDVETGASLGFALWKRAGLRAPNAAVSAFGASIASVSSTRALATVQVPGHALALYAIELTHSSILLTPSEPDRHAPIEGFVDEDRDLLVTTEIDGQRIELHSRPERISVRAAVLSLLPFGRAPSAMEASDRPCRTPFQITDNDAAGILAVYAIIRWCLSRHIFFANDLGSGSGSAGAGAGPP